MLGMTVNRRGRIVRIDSLEDCRKDRANCHAKSSGECLTYPYMLVGNHVGYNYYKVVICLANNSTPGTKMMEYLNEGRK